MKQCSWCGREYPDDATECAVDARALQKMGGPRLEPHEAYQTVNTTPVPNRPSDDTISAAASKAMLVGGLWCGGGILVTALTYADAANSPTGGTYVVAWGAIVFGGIRFYHGWRLSQECEQNVQLAQSKMSEIFPISPPPLASGLQSDTPPIPEPIEDQVSTPLNAPAPRFAKTKWKCPVCGEECEPQFQSCWRCQTVRKDIAI